MQQYYKFIDFHILNNWKIDQLNKNYTEKVVLCENNVNISHVNRCDKIIDDLNENEFLLHKYFRQLNIEPNCNNIGKNKKKHDNTEHNIEHNDYEDYYTKNYYHNSYSSSDSIGSYDIDDEPLLDCDIGDYQIIDDEKSSDIIIDSDLEDYQIIDDEKSSNRDYENDNKIISVQKNCGIEEKIFCEVENIKLNISEPNYKLSHNLSYYVAREELLMHEIINIILPRYKKKQLVFDTKWINMNHIKMTKLRYYDDYQILCPLFENRLHKLLLLIQTDLKKHGKLMFKYENNIKIVPIINNKNNYNHKDTTFYTYISPNIDCTRADIAKRRLMYASYYTNNNENIPFCPVSIKYYNNIYSFNPKINDFQSPRFLDKRCKKIYVSPYENSLLSFSTKMEIKINCIKCKYIKERMHLYLELVASKIHVTSNKYLCGQCIMDVSRSRSTTDCIKYILYKYWLLSIDSDNLLSWLPYEIMNLILNKGVCV
jgi:hypothetical protein